MTYAPASTPIYDADSHIMELPDFLRDFADPSIRDELPQVSYSASLVSDEEVAVILDQGGKHSEAHVNEQIALGDELIAKSKEIQALGAFTRSDRTTALDMLGFKKQLVFATHSVAFPFHPSSKKDPVLRYGAARAHNRHMAHFCEEDNRFLGVGVIPLDDPARAMSELEAALDLGMKAIWCLTERRLIIPPATSILSHSGSCWHRRTPLSSARAHRSLGKAWSNNGRAKVRAGWGVEEYSPKTQR